MIDQIGITRGIFKMGSRPILNLYEGWQDEAGIDTTIWTKVETGTGTVTRDVTEPPYLKVVLAGAAALDTARLYGDQRWFCNCDTGMANYLKQSILQTLQMEFEVKFVNADKIDNTKFFMGLASIQTADETTDNILGFVLSNADEVDFISADAGGHSILGTFLTSAEMVKWHRVRLSASPGNVTCYRDGELVFNLPISLPETAMFPVFYLPQENAAGAPSLHVGIIRIWPEDVLR